MYAVTYVVYQGKEAPSTLAAIAISNPSLFYNILSCNFQVEGIILLGKIFTLQQMHKKQR